MYFYTISVKMGGVYTVRANSFAEACSAVGVDYMRATVIKVANA